MLYINNLYKYKSSKKLHDDHTILFLYSSGGMCDCGDPDSLRKFCPNHTGPFKTSEEIQNFIENSFTKDEIKNFVKLAYLFDYIMLDLLRRMFIFSITDVLNKLDEYNAQTIPPKKENILNKNGEYIT